MIEKLRQFEKSIVPAPWKHDLGNWDVEGPNREEIVVKGDSAINYVAHLQFIQEMRNALPKLLALYDAVKNDPEFQSLGANPDVIAAIEALEQE